MLLFVCVFFFVFFFLGGGGGEGVGNEVFVIDSPYFLTGIPVMDDRTTAEKNVFFQFNQHIQSKLL